MLKSKLKIHSLRLYALSRRLGLTSGAQLQELFNSYLGCDIKKHNLKKALTMAIEQITNIGEDRFQIFLHDMEKYIGKRICLYLISAPAALKNYKTNHMDAISRLGLSSVYNEKSIKSLDKQLAITHISVENNKINIRFSQIREAIDRQGVVQEYYFLAHAEIDLANGLCILYLDNKLQYDQTSYLEIKEAIEKKICFIMTIPSADFSPFDIGDVLTYRLKNALSKCSSIQHDCLLHSCAEEQIEGTVLAGQLGRTLADRTPPNFSVHLRREAQTQLAAGAYVTQMKCKQIISASRELTLNYSSKGDILCGDGLLIEGEVSNVISRLLQDREDLRAGSALVHQNS